MLIDCLSGRELVGDDTLPVYPFAQSADSTSSVATLVVLFNFEQTAVKSPSHSTVMHDWLHVCIANSISSDLSQIL